MTRFIKIKMCASHPMKRILLYGTLACTAVVGFHSTLLATRAQAIGRVEWNVEDNFRLLKDPLEQQWLKSVSLDSEDVRFARVKISQLQSQWKTVPDTYFNETSNRYDREYVNPSNRTWSVRLSSTSAKYGELCHWSIGGISRQASCHDYVPDVSLNHLPTTVIVTSSNGSTDSSVITIRDKLFVAIGDSFASGEGQPDVMRLLHKRKADWWDNKCHRSLYAWPVLTAARYAQMHPHESVTFVSRACSGAVFSDVTGLVQSPNNPEIDIPAPLSSGSGGEGRRSVGGSRFLLPQITQLTLDLCKVEPVNNSCPAGQVRKPDYILLSLGGNDAAFAKTIVDGLLGRINKGIELETDIVNRTRQSVDFLERQYKKLPALMSAAFADAPVIMTIYPDPLHITGNAFCGYEAGRHSSYINAGRTIYKPIQDTGFLSNGLEALVAKLLNKRITEYEVAGIHDDYYLRLTGRSFGGGEEPELQHDYRGMRSIGMSLAKSNPGIWTVVETNKNYQAGTSPHELDDSPRDTDQYPCFRPMGYCRAGSSVTGRWFLNLTDSLDRIGNIYGAMHPNIYGQLYYVSHVYPRLSGVAGKVQTRSFFTDDPSPKKQLDPPGNNLLDNDEQNFKCLTR